MLEDFYYSLSLYDDLETDWDNPPTDDNGSLTLNKSFNGYIQGRGGSSPQLNQSNLPINTHILYTATGNDVIEGQFVKDGDIYYKVIFTNGDRGVSSLDDHDEIGLVMQSDIDDLS